MSERPRSGLQPTARPNLAAVSMSLREFRLSRQLSLRDLAAMSGINRGTLSQIEQGKRLPEARQIRALSDALGVPAESWRIRFVLETEVSPISVDND